MAAINKRHRRSTATGYVGTKRTLGIDASRPNRVNCNRPLLHRLVWNGDTRPGWQLNRSDMTNGGLTIVLGGACGGLPAGCLSGGGPTNARDHTTRYRAYISQNAAAQIFCDGQCHWYGITQEDAIYWSNDTANLTALCHLCHAHKTAQEGNPMGGGAPTPAGPCPAQNGGVCHADVNI